MRSYHLEGSAQAPEFICKIPLSPHLRKKIPGLALTCASSTSILSPSCCGWYFPARLYKIISKESHIDKSRPGRRKPRITLELNVTLESWVLVTVERHFSMKRQGRVAPSELNERPIVRRLGQHARESPAQSASWIYMSNGGHWRSIGSLTGRSCEDVELLQ